MQSGDPPCVHNDDHPTLRVMAPPACRVLIPCQDMWLTDLGSAVCGGPAGYAGAWGVEGAGGGWAAAAMTAGSGWGQPARPGAGSGGFHVSERSVHVRLLDDLAEGELLAVGDIVRVVGRPGGCWRGVAVQGIGGVGMRR